MSPATVGIVVVNYRSSALLRANIASLDVDPERFVVVVVDNRSDDEERRAVSELAASCGWRFVARPDNRGFGDAANEGVRAALDLGVAGVILLNPDAQPAPGVLAELGRAVLDDPRTLVSPAIVSPARHTHYRGSVVDLRRGRIRRGGSESGGALAWLPATCLAVPAAVFDVVGGFAPEYFMYWEDVDLTVRALEAGFRLAVREDLTVVHDSGGTQLDAGERAKSPLYYRFNCRNRLLFAAQHLDRRTVLRWLAATPRESWQIVLQGGRRQLVRSPRPLLAAARGTIAGIVFAVRALVRGPNGVRT